MSYRHPQHRYTSRRTAHRLARKSKRNFIITIIIVIALTYSTLNWVLPFFIGGVGTVKNVVSPTQKTAAPVSQTAALAPPVLSIPYEATSTAQIDIRGYGTPGSKVKLYLDDAEKDLVEIDEDGSFAFENISLSLGTNNIYGKTVDENDKESLPSKTLKITYDNEKPALTISEPEDNEQVLGSANKTIEGGDKKVKISGNTEIGAKVYINGSQVIVGSDGNFSSEQPLNDGDNVFDIKSVDSSGNSTELQRRITFKP